VDTSIARGASLPKYWEAKVKGLEMLAGSCQELLLRIYVLPLPACCGQGGTPQLRGEEMFAGGCQEQALLIHILPVVQGLQACWGKDGTPLLWINTIQYKLGD